MDLLPFDLITQMFKILTKQTKLEDGMYIQKKSSLSFWYNTCYSPKFTVKLVNWRDLHIEHLCILDTFDTRPPDIV